MKSIFKSEKEQSDYPEGCLEIQAHSVKEAFELGQMFGKMVAANHEIVTGLDHDSMVFIRVPVTSRKIYQEDQ